jgi:ABC transporter DrrB family efflux protein
LLFELSAAGTTLLVTTHYMDEAERCTDIGYIYESKMIVCGEPDDLKAMPEVTPAGTRRWELELDDPARYLARLRKFDEVHDATLFGQTIHVLAAEALSGDELLGHLDAPRHEAHARPIEPSLEDVFVTLSRAAEKQRMGLLPEPTGMEDDDPDSALLARIKPQAREPEKVEAAPPPEPPRDELPERPRSTWGLMAVLTKEFFHIQRQPTTLLFVFVIPTLQTIIFGYAIDVKIEHIPTVVQDLDGRRHAKELIETFENTRTFEVVGWVTRNEDFRRAITSGKAKVGVRIPPDYSDRLLSNEQVQVQVLIDGSDSQVATTALNATKLLGINQSITISRSMADVLQVAPARNEEGEAAMPVEVRPRLLFNPDLESSHFFVPGLVGIIMQLVTLFLTAFAIVRERELGTLEQLFVTPVGRVGLLLGKLVPYAIVGFVAMLIVLTVMVYVFRVPIHGDLTLLLGLSTLFLVCALGLGLLVSTLARTQLEAMQFAFIIMLPSVLLSGFVFPRSEMPWAIYLITFAIPATYFLEILRGIVLRGADFVDLLPQTLGLAVCCTIILILSVTRFRKQLA